MTRNEFLKIIGLSATTFISLKVLNSCSTDSPTAPQDVDFTIDLNDPAFSNLKVKGNFVIKDNIIIAHTSTGEYVALSAKCTHEGTIIEYDVVDDIFYCPNHGSLFKKDGSVQKGPAKKSLKRYNVELNGDLLRVYS